MGAEAMQKGREANLAAAALRRSALVWALVLAPGLGGVGCGTGTETGKEAVVEERAGVEALSLSDLDRVRRAVLVAGEIEKEPERSAEILRANQLTEEDFDALMYDIASDPALSAAYQKARE